MLLFLFLFYSDFECDECMESITRMGMHKMKSPKQQIKDFCRKFGNEKQICKENAMVFANLSELFVNTMTTRQICELYERCPPENQNEIENNCNDCSSLIDGIKKRTWAAFRLDTTNKIVRKLLDNKNEIDSLIERGFGSVSICKNIGACKLGVENVQFLSINSTNKTNTTRPTIAPKRRGKNKGPTRTPKPIKTPKAEVKPVDYLKIHKNKTLWGQCSAPIDICNRGYNCSAYSGCEHLTFCKAFGVGCVNTNCTKCKDVLSYMTTTGRENFTISLMSGIWDDICTNTLRMEDVTCQMAKADENKLIKNFFNFFATKMSSQSLCYASKLCP